MRNLRPAAAVVLLLSCAAHGHAQTAPEPPPSTAATAATAASATAAAEALEAVRRVGNSPLGQCVRQPPPYPHAALRAEAEGTTVVVFLIDAQGQAGGAAVHRSSGHAALDAAAVTHLQRCIAKHAQVGVDGVTPGRYALPMVWRIE